MATMGTIILIILCAFELYYCYLINEDNMKEFFKNKYFQAATGVIVILFSLSLYNILSLRKLKKQVDKPQPAATDQGEPLKPKQETEPQAPTFSPVPAVEPEMEPVKIIEFPTNNEVEKVILLLDKS